MKTENIVPQMESIDISQGNQFLSEFIRFTRQLSEMKKWFRKYNKLYDDDLKACFVLDDRLIDCANAISELAACEFVDSYFFNEDKSEMTINNKKKGKTVQP